MDTVHKLISPEAFPAWREAMKASGKVLVVTNGCFDLLHAGHVAYLEAARSLGDALLVGLNGDSSVRELKGPTRPLNIEGDRARVLAALECVSAVAIFPEKRAVRFLATSRPDIYVKGGDYTLEERQAVESGGGRIVFIPFLPGRSTTGLVAKIQTL
jgi:rfaE bifunctional protein nucleotidyltransferase chain/domain